MATMIFHWTRKASQKFGPRNCLVSEVKGMRFSETGEPVTSQVQMVAIRLRAARLRRGAVASEGGNPETGDRKLEYVPAGAGRIACRRQPEGRHEWGEHPRDSAYPKGKTNV